MLQKSVSSSCSSSSSSYSSSNSKSLKIAKKTKANKKQILELQTASIDEVIKDHIDTLLKGKYGNLLPDQLSPEVKEKLSHANLGSESLWLKRFKLLRLNYVKDALSTANGMTDQDISDIANQCFESMTSSIEWGGCSDATDYILSLRNDADFKAYLMSFCQKYETLLDIAVLNVSGKGKTMAKANLLLLDEWKSLMFEEKKKGIEWLKQFSCKYEGGLSGERLVYTVVARIETEIRQHTTTKLRLKGAIPLTSTPLSYLKSKLTNDTKGTIYYIAGAVVLRTLKHFKKLELSTARHDDRIAMSLNYLSRNIVTREQAERSKLHIHIVDARVKLNLVFVSKELYDLFEFIELMFSTNTSLRHLRSYSTDLFPMIESIILKNKRAEELFARGALSEHGIDTVAAGGEADSNPDPLGIANLFYKELFKTILQKYRKVREADFIKVILSDKKVRETDTEALRRTLKQQPKPKGASMGGIETLSDEHNPLRDIQQNLKFDHCDSTDEEDEDEDEDDDEGISHVGALLRDSDVLFN